LFTMAVAPGRTSASWHEAACVTRYSYAQDSSPVTDAAMTRDRAPPRRGDWCSRPGTGCTSGGATFGIVSESDAAAPHGLTGTQRVGLPVFSGPSRGRPSIARRAERLLDTWPSCLSNPLPAWRWTRAMARGRTSRISPPSSPGGWAASAHWLVTGVRSGQNVEPEHSIFAGPGAIEASLRFEAFPSTTPGRRPERAVPRSVRKTCGRPRRMP
jgi:hypothetical protein